MPNANPIDGMTASRTMFGPVYALPIDEALPVSLGEPFYDAFIRAVALS